MKRLLTSAMIAPLLAAIAMPAPAMAAGQSTARVVYRDLDLSSAAGRATFDRRVRTATTRVCGHLTRTDLNEIASIVECRRQVARAVAARMAPILAAAKSAGPVRGTD
jgi:UrcA family protein